MQNILNQHTASFHILFYFLIFSFVFINFQFNTKAQKTPSLPTVKQTTPTTEKSKEVSGKQIESEKNRLFRKDTILRINEILQKVQKHYPSLAEELSDQDKENIIKSLVETLNCSMEYSTALEQQGKTAKQQVTKKKNTTYPAIIIASHKVLYIRIDSFTADTVKQLQTDCISSFRLANPPAGVILDLRSAQDYNCILALKALGLFNSPEKIPLPEGTKPLTKVLNTPVMLLIGEKTKGAPEIFAMLMAQSESGMLLGEKTAGTPFKKQQIPLNNGDSLMIPIVPKHLDSFKPESTLPTINFSAYPQLEFEKLRKEAGSEITDQCLQRAIDLIICLKALSTRKK
jgi:peptidase S41-like protein